MFGFVTYAQQTVTLTRLGNQLNDPQQEKAAKADGFLVVPLYNAIYEQYKGVTLPPNDALEAEMVKLGVAPKQKDKARQVFQRSASEAGYFWSGSNRLVRPAIKSSTPASTKTEELPNDVDTEVQRKKPDEKKDRRHPLIEGLLTELPEPQSEWTTEDRKKWLEMASTIFNVIYKDSDDSRGSLKVVVERNSAK
jgi:hypothetical protein